ncbi:PhaM family polyhydroxyalkanoate granule multifunctional regulatory protein [Paraherbaspirillum soli]|uniref:PhaM family polyhydroxyalkanoate granule multifunctional regulatory protein n=1 Tax=Paraherbaspirillum soli TaxID=631222 RepID=A0ABW0M2P3_9BURK
MAGTSIPGIEAMQDSLEFIKKMWTGLGVPGMVVPTLSVEEINKKITDLKAVESWLNLNLTMLRTTIQALEVQSATLSALQAMGTINSPASANATGDTESGAAAWASKFPFSFMTPTPNAASAQDPAQKESTPAADKPAATPDLNASLGNANAWWDLLQNQFKQVVSNVVAAEEAAKPETKAAPNSDAKAETKSSAKPAKAPTAPKSKSGAKTPSGSSEAKPVSGSGKTKTVAK